MASQKQTPTYIYDGQYPVVYYNELPEDQKEPFNKWMQGQTMIVDDQGIPAPYYWDYERWYNSWIKGREAVIYD